MFIIFRGWYFAGVAGLGLAVYGSIETQLAFATASQPEAISVAELESGKRPKQSFVRIDKHHAVYENIVCQKKRNRIRDAVYPILSLQHPWCVAWGKLLEKYGDTASVPPSEIPGLSGPAVLVLTDRFDDRSDVPSGRVDEGSVGILFEYDELDSKGRELVDIGTRFNHKQTVILELGRRPKPLWVGLLLAAVGLLLSGWASFLFFKKKDDPNSKAG